MPKRNSHDVRKRLRELQATVASAMREIVSLSGS